MLFLVTLSESGSFTGFHVGLFLRREKYTGDEARKSLRLYQRLPPLLRGLVRA